MSLLMSHLASYRRPSEHEDFPEWTGAPPIIQYDFEDPMVLFTDTYGTATGSPNIGDVFLTKESTNPKFGDGALNISVADYHYDYNFSYGPSFNYPVSLTGSTKFTVDMWVCMPTVVSTQAFLKIYIANAIDGRNPFGGFHIGYSGGGEDPFISVSSGGYYRSTSPVKYFNISTFKIDTEYKHVAAMYDLEKNEGRILVNNESSIIYNLVTSNYPAESSGKLCLDLHKLNYESEDSSIVLIDKFRVFNQLIYPWEDSTYIPYI